MDSDSTTKAKRAAPPHAWKKGQSGNPGGRKSIPDDVKAAFTSMLPRALKVLSELLDSEDEHMRHKAAETVLDRNLGKVTQHLQHGGDVQIVVVDPYAKGGDGEPR